MILESTGFATLSTSIERDVDLHQRVESTEVLENLDIRLMDPSVDLVELHGREEIPRSCTDIAKSDLNFSSLMLFSCDGTSTISFLMIYQWMSRMLNSMQLFRTDIEM